MDKNVSVSLKEDCIFLKLKKILNLISQEFVLDVKAARCILMRYVSLVQDYSLCKSNNQFITSLQLLVVSLNIQNNIKSHLDQ